jgi:flagellar motor switch protein FliN/FliY
MSLLAADIVPQLVSACRDGADKLAAALGQALGGDFAASVGEAGPHAAATPQGFAGPGLVLLVASDGAGLAAVITASSGLAPAWCANPDEAAAARLAKLAHKFGEVLAPTGVPTGSVEIHWVSHVGKALGRAGLASDATSLPIELRSAERTAPMTLVWPLAAPENIADAGADKAPQSAGASPGKAATAAPGDRDFSRLPHYSRSLLKIRVPISVQLASRKETVREVVALAPGSIIKFEKNCDELLQMIVGEQPVAEGEAVKVGDKFGFRVTSMLMPREHFLPLGRPRTGS